MSVWLWPNRCDHNTQFWGESICTGHTIFQFHFVALWCLILQRHCRLYSLLPFAWWLILRKSWWEGPCRGLNTEHLVDYHECNAEVVFNLFFMPASRLNLYSSRTLAHDWKGVSRWDHELRAPEFHLWMFKKSYQHCMRWTFFNFSQDYILCNFLAAISFSCYHEFKSAMTTKYPDVNFSFRAVLVLISEAWSQMSIRSLPNIIALVNVVAMYRMYMTVEYFYWYRSKLAG